MKNYSVLSVVVLILVLCSAYLAVIDPSNRGAFIDLTKICVGSLLGLWIPSPQQKGTGS